MSKISLFVLLLFVASAVASKDKCDLKCFINKIKIPLPNITKKILFWNLYLSNGYCSGIKLGNISSQLNTNYSIIDANFTKLGIECSLDYSWGIFSGNATGYAKNSKISAEVQFIKNSKNGLVKETHLKNSNVFVDITDIHFSSSFLNSALIKKFTIRFINSELPYVIEEYIRIGINHNLTAAFQWINTRISGYLNGKPPVVHVGSFSHTPVNMFNNSVIHLGQYILNDIFGGSINDIMNHWTNGTGIIEKRDLHLNYNMSLMGAQMTFGLENVSFSGLNTWRDITVLKPQLSVVLGNKVNLDSFCLDALFYVDTQFQKNNLYESGRLQLSTKDFTFLLDLIIAIYKKFVNALNYNQLTCDGCLKDSVMMVNANQSRIGFHLDQLEISAINQNGTLEQKLDILLNNVIELFVHSYSHTIPAFFNAFAIEKLLDVLNKKIGDLVEPNTPCLLNVSPKGNWHLNAISTSLAFSIAFAIWLIIAIITLVIQRGLRKDDYSELLLEPNNYQINDALFFNTQIHIIFRFGLLLVILMNISLFIASNTSIGASVFVNVILSKTKTITTDSLFDFTLINSIHDMWQAEVYVLALLIAIFSGAWPYLKLILMGICWVLPTHRLSFVVREKILRFLDAMGKWSLIDAFILVFMMIVFSISVTAPPNVADKITVFSFVRPQIGFHAFVLATICSFVLSHLILLFHRRTYRKKEMELVINDDFPTPNNNTTITSLAKERFLVNVYKVRFTSFGMIIIIILWISSVALLITGTFMNSFVFQIRGTTSIVLEYLQIPIDRPFSLFSLITQFPKSSDTPHAFSIIWIQIVFALFAFAIPVLYGIVLLALWLVPMKRWLQKVIFIATEIFRAWSAIEVFVLAILTSLVALERFVGFIVGNRCLWIDGVLQEYFPWIFPDQPCLIIKTTLLPGFWVLLTGVILFITVGHVVIFSCHCAIEHHNNEYTRLTIWMVKFFGFCKLLNVDEDIY